MPADLIHLHPHTPDERRLRSVAGALREGAVVVYPTDTIYGLGCDIHNTRAVERVARIKGVQPRKNDFSFICYDLSHIADYARVEDAAFKLMKRLLPGPFTFILTVSSRVPKLLQTTRKTVGIRVPAHAIPRGLVRELGNPIITTSVHAADPLVDYETDPERIYAQFRHQVDIVIDGGPGGHIPSTIIDATTADFSLIRQGLGQWDNA